MRRADSWTKLSLGLAATLALAACSTSAGSPPDTSLPPPVDCGAERLAGSVGGVVTGTTAADVRIDGLPIAAQGDVRVIYPGQPVIQNYSPSRLNLEVTNAGTLIRATCG